MYPDCDIEELFDSTVFGLQDDELNDRDKVKHYLNELLALDCTFKKIVGVENSDSYPSWEKAVKRAALSISSFRKAMAGTKISPEVHQQFNQANQKFQAQYEQFKATHDYSEAAIKVRTLRDLTCSYLKNRSSLNSAKENTPANQLLDKKYQLVSELFNISMQKKEAQVVLQEFESQFKKIQNDPDLQKHTDPLWKRLLKNIVGVLLFCSEPIYSKIKYNTFCFWKPESEQLFDYMDELLSQSPTS